MKTPSFSPRVPFERVIDLCTTAGTGENEQQITPEFKEAMLEQMTFLAKTRSASARRGTEIYHPGDPRASGD